jgi:putative heme-binding domain-containing protein
MVRNPDKEITGGYEMVTAVRTDGQRITGIRANEDTFSVQIRDLSGTYHSLHKDSLREVIDEPRSMMPPYSPHTISAGELDDLVSYLVSLRGR